MVPSCAILPYVSVEVTGIQTLNPKPQTVSLSFYLSLSVSLSLSGMYVCLEYICILPLSLCASLVPSLHVYISSIYVYI